MAKLAQGRMRVVDVLEKQLAESEVVEAEDFLDGGASQAVRGPRQPVYGSLAFGNDLFARAAKMVKASRDVGRKRGAMAERVCDETHPSDGLAGLRLLAQKGGTIPRRLWYPDERAVSPPARARCGAHRIGVPTGRLRWATCHSKKGASQ